MISAIHVRNLKSFGPEPTQVGMAPLTLLVGPNGSGKTTVLEALGVLVQSIRDRSRNGIALDGPVVRLGSREVALHRRDERAELTLGVTVSARSAGLDVWWPGSESVRYEVTTWMTPERGSWHNFRHVLALGEDIVATSAKVYLPQSRTGASIQDEVSIPALGVKSRAHDYDQVLAGEAFQPTDGPADETQRDRLRQLRNTVDDVAELLRERTSFLSEIRGGDLFVREIGGLVVRSGRHGEDTIRLLTIAQADAARREKMRRLAHWAGEFGMPELTGGWVGHNELALTYTDARNGTALPISSAGGGSKQILPFLVDSLTAPGPRVFCVDEIEHGLHPAFLVKLAALLREVVEAGHQVIATTQSPTLVLAICAEVARGLAPERVALHAVERSDRGVTHVRRLPVTPSGWIEGGWIEDYAKVERDLFRSFLHGEPQTEDE